MGSKILLVGASGSIGRHLFARLGPERAVGTYASTPVEGAVRFDATTQRLRDWVDDPKAFSHALVLSADSQPDSCIADPAKSRRINVEAAKAMIDDLLELGITPIFASTEFVFDGAKGNYVEDDAAEPILLYGEQKLEVERYLLGLSGARWAALRIAKVFGERPENGGLLTGWAEAIAKGTPVIRCATDQAFSPLYVEDFLGFVLGMVENDVTGLYHISGNRRFRRDELLALMIEAMGARTEIEPCSIHDFDLPEKRPLDVSLKADKLIDATGHTPSAIEDVAARIARAHL